VPALIAALARHAAVRPTQPALSDGVHHIDYGAAYRLVRELTVAIRSRRPARIGLALDNGPSWLLLDLACLAAQVPCVAVPGFFSPSQQAHLIRDSEVELLITDRPAFYAEMLGTEGLMAEDPVQFDVGGACLAQLVLQRRDRNALPPRTAKITYTSGTTGAPKGVCLDADTLARVAQSLVTACELGREDRHVSLLPLATLLENAGAYAMLLAGATCIMPPTAEIGLPVTAAFDCERMLRQLARHRATTAIATPQMVDGVMQLLETGAAPLESLRFLAVGGAPVPASLVDGAASVGLPLYQGYGLTECASVVTLNTPASNRRGSVGRPLPHASVSLAPDGEVLVCGAALLGYCGSPADMPEVWPTGDFGYMEDGYLYLTGRKKNIFITSFGRNVAPEWVECELTGTRAIGQAWVYGEGRPWNAAVVTPARGSSFAEIDAAISGVNATLPAYARILAWIPSLCPFSYSNGELTANGRLCRDVLLAHYRSRIDQLYKEIPAHVL
jgi:long-chain acyl-CoA synthetase